MSRSRLAYGIVGAVAATAAAGAAATGLVVQRRRRTEGRDLPQRFDELDPDRTSTVYTDDGVALHVEEVGPRDAPLTVVFVHGFALSRRSFYFQRQALTDKFGDAVRMVFYDQRGHGRSGPGVPDGSTVEQLGRDLWHVLDVIAQTGPVVLVGHSMGGMTVLTLATQQSQLFAPGPRRRGRAASARVVGVALICTSDGGLADVTLGLPALVSRLRGPLAPFLLRTARRQADLVEQGRRIGGDLAWVITRRFSFGAVDIDPSVVDFLHGIISGTRIEVIADFYPTLMTYDARDGVGVVGQVDGVVISGELDRLTPPAHGRRIAERWPRAEYREIEGCGHVAVLERPDVVDAALIELVDRVTPPTPARGR
ncbi:MAG: alpha/beta hydrolase [bacterium]